MIVAAANICWTVTKCQIQTSKCFNPHQKNLWSLLLLLSPFYRYGNGGSEKFRNLYKVGEQNHISEKYLLQKNTFYVASALFSL